eukprot:TRINITY_DN3787_c0_g1_i1.p1 TRINITY_DN3787_c0_g1~~TRINITY_DN3787_c0_g1_i1.p1  ORF type:complete len:803 (+),score=199.68 TRINITY_DN3787_c0_g1_i1:303-2411(+)
MKEGGFVSGGSDKVVMVWDRTSWEADEKDPLLNLIGHLEPVTCLARSAAGQLISGSSDMSVRVWEGNVSTQELRGHTAPVWSVVSLPNGDIVSASGDRLLKIWREGACFKTITHHQDAVRGVADLPGVGFLSVSNDSSLCLWSYEGELLKSISNAHDSFIYDVKVLSSGEFITSSEDRTVRVWKDFSPVEILKHPAGVWKAAELANGDIVTAGEDGVVRVFTRDPTRAAEPDVFASYEKELAEVAAKDAVGDLELDRLPGPEALLVPGTKAGENLMIQKEGKAFMYSWDAEGGEWTLVGEIMNAKDNEKRDRVESGKRLLGGKEYDFVFDVDVGEGRDMLKLGYNSGENPYLAAQQFIEDNMLNQNFLEEITQFIVTNAGASVGAGKNVPAGNTAVAPIAAPPAASGSTATATTTTSTVSTNSSFFPQLTPLLFEVGNLANVHKKLLEFNQSLSEDESLLLNDAELTHLSDIMSTLSRTRFYHASSFSLPQFAILEKLISWPSAQLFPVIDLLRLAALHPSASKHFINSNIFPLVLEKGFISVADGAHPANALLTARFIANTFGTPHAADRKVLVGYQELFCDHFSDHFESMNRNGKIAVSTCLLNLCVQFRPSSAAEEKVTQVIALAHSLLNDELSSSTPEEEVVFRLLVAIATVCSNGSESRKALLNDLGGDETLSSLSSFGSEKVRACASDFVDFLASV